MKNRSMGRDVVAAVVNLIAVAVEAVRAVVFSRTRRDPMLEGAQQGTADFEALRKARESAGPASVLAGKLMETASPFEFSLKSAHSETGFRELIDFLATNTDRVSFVNDKPGTSFNVSRHVPASPILKVPMRLQERAVVFLDPAGSVLLKSSPVRTCSVDWWLAALANENCPVAALLQEQAEDYTMADPDEEGEWTASEGFDVLKDLRKEDLTEADLQRWATQLRDGLQAAYPNDSDKQLMAHGAEGSDLASSTMEVEGDRPLGRARVIEVVERDGEPQLGWGCPKCTPLLKAVVRVEAVL
jgi:hypothetical protein